MSPSPPKPPEEAYQPFNSLSHNQKLNLIFQTLLNSLAQIGEVSARLKTLEICYTGMKEQLDVVANNDFLKQTMKEKTS